MRDRGGGQQRVVRVWDLPTRLFHWLLALLIAGAYATWRLDWMAWHELIGEAVLALVLFRLVWGFIGSDSARFSRFLASPGAAWRHLRHLWRREPDHQPGHNAAGGWMVVVMLFLLLAETLTGMFVAKDVADVGRFTEMTPAGVANAIDALHALVWDALLAAMALHLLAILVYVAIKRQNLVRPMIVGTKLLPESVPPPRLAGGLRAALALAGGVATAALIVNLL